MTPHKKLLTLAAFAVAGLASAAVYQYQSSVNAPPSTSAAVPKAAQQDTAQRPVTVQEFAAIAPSFAEATHRALIDDGLAREIQKAGASGQVGAFVHFSDRDLSAQNERLRRLGLSIHTDFRQFATSVFATGTAASFLNIATDPSVFRLEWNEPLKFYNHTANWAIRTRVAQERVGDGPYYDGLGRILDGTGVGVAVIDSGLDGTHGDFNLALNGGRNYKATCAPNLNPCVGSFVDVGTTGTSDTSSGHGHHVAGTVLGSGARSTVNYPDAAGTPYIKGSFAGVAPNAKLFAYGTGEAVAVLFAAQSYNHLLANYDNPTVFPTKIRVTNNSYGNAGGTAYTATNTLSQLVKRIVEEKGVIVAFAAGNDGDGTTNDTTSGYCKDPTPGVICVASYDDLGTGSLNGVLSDFTSQGAIGAPANYPDIAAPGSNILSTCTAGLPICKDTGGGDQAYLPFYGTISGTSMATPHVVGAIALLLQARPELTPPAVEKLLQDTARKVVDNTYGAAQGAYVNDPQNAGGTTNYRAGAGLVDFPRLLDAVNVAKFGSLPTATEHTVISGDQAAAGGADAGSINAFAANDIVKLTMQDEVKSGTTGLTFRLSVADAADLGGASFIRYQVLYNVDGRGYSTAVTLRAAGLTADGKSASTNAPATSASVEGNVLRFFVPLTSLGSPSPGAPVHNIRVNARSDVNGSEAEVDYAPSRTPDVDTQATAPGWGKPYTIVTPVQGTPVVENRCEAPGVTVLNDGGGDSLTTENQDLLSASVAQPFAASGNPNFVFTIKVASLATLTAGSGYYVSFNTPAGFRGVRMQVVNPTAPTFITYTPSANNAGGVDGRFVGANSPAAAGSNYNAATGVITIVATPASIGLASVGEMLQGFNGGVTQSSDPGVGIGGATAISDEMPDGLGRAGSFTYLANAFCAPNQAPVAVLTATPNPQGKGVDVTFQGANSSDPNGDDLVEYRFDFGDGSQPAAGAASSRTHAYALSGNYTAKLTVKDARGLDSTVTEVVVTITNAAPTVALTADRTEGNPPLTVSFTATGADADASDAAGLLYSYDFDGNGSFELVDVAAGPRSFEYTSVGTFTAKVQVKDSEGVIGTDEVVITVQEAVGDLELEFIERLDVRQSTFITSEEVTPKGLTGPVSISISGNDNSQYRINGGAWVSGPGTLRPGDTLAVRHISAADSNKATVTTLTIAGNTVPFKSITGLDRIPDAYNFGTVNNVAPGVLVESPVLTLLNYDIATASPGPGVSYRINGGAWTTAKTEMRRGDTLQVRHMSNKSSLGYTKSYIDVGGVRGNFVSRTRK